MATVLTAGDIAFVEFASDAPKSFAFVLLRDVAAGTAINFTDNGWQAAGGFRANEGTIAWTAAEAVTAGTVVRLDGVAGGFNLSTAGDQILAYQGEAGAPSFVTAIQFNGATWDSDATNANSSALPTGLANGSTAIAVGNVDNGVYSGPLGGDPATIRAALNDAANWTTNDSAPQRFAGTFAFTGADEPSVAIAVSPDSASEADGAFTYTITGTNLTEPVTITVSFSGTADASDLVGADPLAPRTIILSPDQPAQSFTLTVLDDDAAEGNETIVATIAVPAGGAAITAGSATATIVDDDAVLTRISAIQGTRDQHETYTIGGTTYTDGSPLRGETVSVEAVVVGDFQDGDADAGRNLRGFFIQQAQTAEDPAGASRGVFVFAPAGLDVNIGDTVRVTGTVSEFFGQTQISAAPDGIAIVQAGTLADANALAVEIALPGDGMVSQGQGGRLQPDLEDHEGMLIRLPDTLTISEQFQLGRFNEIRLFDTNGFTQTGSDGQPVTGERAFQYTQHNAPDAAGFQNHLREVASRTIVYDDGLNTQNQAIPNLDGFGPVYDTATAPRMGDTITGLTGVLEHGWAGNAASGATWRVRSVEDGANEFTRGNANPEPAPVDYTVAGDLKIATLNVLNFFTTLSGTTAVGASPRGANNQAEYERQLEKLVSALTALDADVVGLLEIENDFRSGGNATPAIQALVSALNDATAPGTYDWVRPGTDFVGGDAISNAFIFKPGKVSVAEGTNPAILDDSNPISRALIEDPANGTSAIFNGSGTSRPPFAVTFTDAGSGEDFTVVVNHFKSKGSPGNAAGDTDQGDGQAASNASRVLAAQAMLEWLETGPTGSATTKQLIMGDLNSYAKEDPIQLLLDGGFVDMAQKFLTDAYNYIFDGQLGTLDYILSSIDMVVDVLGAAIARFNSDEASALDYNLDFGRDPSIFDGTSPARSSDHDPIMVGVSFGSAEPEPFKLQLLHLADGEAGLLAGQTAPWLAGLIDAFEGAHANTLILSGGDNFLPGPFSAAGTDPALNAVVGRTAPFRPDIAIHNALGVQVSAIGNHEFDFGSNAFQDAIRPDREWIGAEFAYVSANIDFTGDPLAAQLRPGGQNVDLLPNGSIAPWVVVEQGGERIGIVGATTQMLANLSSPTGATIRGIDGQPRNDMDLLAAQLQPIIDEMQAQGINKIILQAHLQQITFEQELATKLNGVDIILAAGSNTRLGNSNTQPVEFPGHEAVFQGNYPLTATGADGNPVLIVNTDNEYTYLGRLVVEFDQNGVLVTDSWNNAESGAYASTEANVRTAQSLAPDADLETTVFADGTRADAVRDITRAVEGVLAEQDGRIFGFTDVYLEAERAIIRNQETNLGNLTADANAAAAREALGGETFVVSLKNAGGIRAPIGTIEAGTGAKLPPAANPAADKPAGAVSQLDIANALRFNNSLMVFDTTAAGLLAILEHGAGLAPNNGGFPQIGGLRFSYDDAGLAGARVQNVALVGEDGQVVRLVEDGEVLASAPSTISVVTLSFTANGGDGYPIKANASNFRHVLQDGTLSAPVDPQSNLTANLPANVLREQQALGDFLEENHATRETAYAQADTPEAGDTRIQNTSLRGDTVFDTVQPEQPPVDPEQPPVDPGPTEPGADGREDVFVAADGRTTIEFAGNLADYRFDNFGEFITVRGEGSATDRLVDFQRLVFADGEIDLSTNSLLFDPLFYATQNLDVYRAGVGSLDHFLAFGEEEGRDPNAFFDVSGYLAANRDVAASSLGAFEHFKAFGSNELRDASFDFDARLYLQANADVATSSFGALEHFLRHGRSEGRETFDIVGQRIGSDGFDEQFYLFANPDVAAAGVDARTHFTQFGASEGRDANRFFDPSFYLTQNGDVAAAGIDPLTHYDDFGWREGRPASETFDGSTYLARNGDVAEAGINPLRHYLEFGIYEGRNIDDVMNA